MQTQKITVKDPCPKKAKTKDPKPIWFCMDVAKPLEQEKKDRKVKQKKFWQRKKRKDTPATGDKIINVSKKTWKQDLNKIMYFVYNKKSHYANDCIKLSKNLSRS